MRAIEARRSLALLAASSPCVPAYRAEYTPGYARPAGTTRPLSSPITHAQGTVASCTALRVAFPRNESAVSATSKLGGRVKIGEFQWQITQKIDHFTYFFLLRLPRTRRVTPFLLDESYYVRNKCARERGQTGRFKGSGASVPEVPSAVFLTAAATPNPETGLLAG